MKTDQSPAANESPRVRKLTRKPALLAAAALIATGALGITLGNGVPFAAAETAQPAQTIETPFGRAPLTFADLVAKVSPAVVSINVKGETKVADNDMQIPGMPDLPEDNPLYDFFKQFKKGMPQGPSKPTPSLAQGSGFFISEDGYVVTNNHVVEDAEDITVTMEDGEKFSAKLVGTDPRTDVALLKITDKTKTSFPFVNFSTKDPRVGDWVLAVGNPFGLGGTVTAGIISAHNRDIGSGPYDYLQIDAAVNRGNSGGPSFDLDGNVIGVNTAIFSPSGGNVGIAFAVPAALVKQVVTELQSHGSVDRGWLGVVIQNVNDDIADSIGLKEPKGAMITKVTEDGPAAKEDIKAGDVIVGVNGDEVEDSRDLARKIAELEPELSGQALHRPLWRRACGRHEAGCLPERQEAGCPPRGQAGRRRRADEGSRPVACPGGQVPGRRRGGCRHHRGRSFQRCRRQGPEARRHHPASRGRDRVRAGRCRGRDQEGHGRLQDGQGYRQGAHASQNRRSDALRGAFTEEGLSIS